MSFYNLIIAVGIKTAQVVCDTITNVGGITVTAVYCRLLRVYMLNICPCIKNGLLFYSSENFEFVINV